MDITNTTKIYSRKIQANRIARILAIQGLYTFDIHDQTLEVNTVLFDTLEIFNLHVKKLKNINMKLFKNLLEGTIKNIESIDHKLSSHLKIEWQLSRLPLLVKEIMRVAVFELTHNGELSCATIIDEYLEIAKVFMYDEDTAFMNGVLDTIQKEIERLHL